MQAIPSSQSLTLKVFVMIVLIFIDIIINSFVQNSFTLTYAELFNINYYYIPIQIIVTNLIFVMVLVLMWQTFPLRYGLIGMILRQFKWTFFFIISFIILTVIQRGLKLSYVVDLKQNFSEVNIWNNGGYVFLYYFRFLTYPLFYGFLINFCLRIIDPTFYRPNRWLK